MDHTEESPVEGLDQAVDGDIDAELALVNEVFSLTSLIDDTAAQRAAERMYANSTNGLRYFSEISQALPCSRAAQAAAELEMLAGAETLPD